MNENLKILFIEDVQNDVELIWRHLKTDNIKFSKMLVETESEFLGALSVFMPDIIISDYSLPEFTGMRALIIKRELAPLIPFILVTGSINEKVAVECMKAGADDYILKENLSRLGEAIKSVLNKKEIERQKEVAEKRMRESEARFKSFTESAPVGIFATDINGVTNYVNPRWCEISRMDSTHALGNGWLFAVHPDDRERISEAWQQSSSAHSISYSEYRFLHADGSVSWVNGQAVPQNDQNGNLIGYIGTITDITQGKLAGNKLVESEVYYRSLINISPDGIITTDLEGNVTFVSMKAYEIFNESTEQDLTGTSIFKWVDPEYHAFLMTRLKDILTGHIKPVSREYKLLKRDRSVFWAELSSCPISDSSENLSGLLIVCRDISERKKAEEELIKARDKAEEGDKLKTAFLHNISHEIRTPMNAITGFSALLTEPDLSKETQASYIEIINQSSDHLLSILNDIIEISNIDAGILKLKKNGTNLNALLERLYKQFSSEAADKNIELGLITGFPEGEANVNIDSGKLLQVLSNLLRNSLKFTHSGKVEFGYKPKDGFLEFYVSDTGIGIQEDKFQKIFNRFYQVEHTEARQYDGTGLGLSISKEYVEMMNGKMWLTSKPGTGSVFYFTTPIEKIILLPEFKHLTGNIRKPEVLRKKTILIAEDDNSNFRLMKQLLSGFDLEIVHAFNGIEAVEICNSGRIIDLVLMDIKMPMMDGYEATREILHNYPSVKIVVQTAYADDISRSLAAGCVGFITKPFNKKQFVEVVKEFL